MDSQKHSTEPYPSWISIAVQWGDMDALGHVNNTVPIRWYESSRISYLERSGVASMLQGLALGPILAAVNCSYLRQLYYPDTVKIACRVSRLGRSSLTLQHQVIREETGEVAAEGESIVVVFNFARQKPVRIPDEVRRCIFDLQPELENTGDRS